MTTTTTSDRLARMAADDKRLEEAHYLAARDALLEHARMGRPVCESRDGQVVWVQPAEIFARYGLDEFGRPTAAPASDAAP